eukprot:3513884-Rhodomonas_salina.2
MTTSPRTLLPHRSASVPASASSTALPGTTWDHSTRSLVDNYEEYVREEQQITQEEEDAFNLFLQVARHRDTGTQRHTDTDTQTDADTQTHRHTQRKHTHTGVSQG